MSIRDNPVLRRELCKLRFWRGRASLSLIIGLVLLLAAVLLPMLVNLGLISPDMIANTLSTGCMAIYVALPILLAAALKFTLDIRQVNGEMDDLQLTLLKPEEIHIGTVWGFVLPVAVGCALLTLGAMMAIVLTGTPSARALTMSFLWWVVTVSNLHFTLVMVIEARESSENPTWLPVLSAVGFSFLFDVMLFGFLFKPVFLVMNLTDSLTTRRGEWFSRRSSPPHRYRGR